MDVDYVIMAIGAKLDKDITNIEGLELTDRGYVKVNENYQTSISGVYAGGDFIGTKGTVAWACKTGHDAAECIDRSIKTGNLRR